MGNSQSFKLNMPTYGFNNNFQMQMPAFDFNTQNFQTPLFNFNPNIGFNDFSFWNSFGSSTATSASSPEAIAAKEAREEENRRKRDEKADEISKKITKLTEEKEKIKTFEKEVTKKGVKVNENTGAVEKKASLKNMSFWQKLGRGLKNAVKGMGNLVKPLLGYDKNGKFSLGKCIRNIAIAAVTTVALICPVTSGAAIAAITGGLISAATAATAITAVGTAATVAGLAIGTGKVVKGGIDTAKACKSGSIEDFDKATQNIGEGTLLAITSAKGLKQIKTSLGPNFTAVDNMAPKAVISNIKNSGWRSAGRTLLGDLKSIPAQIGNEADLAYQRMSIDGIFAGARNYKALLAQDRYNIARRNYENKLTATIDKLEVDMSRTSNNSKWNRLFQQYTEATEKLERFRSLNTKDDWTAVMSAKDKPLLQRRAYKKSVSELKPLQKAAENAAFKSSKASRPGIREFATDFGYSDKSSWYQRFYANIGNKWKNTSKTEKTMIVGGLALGAPEGAAGMATMSVGYPLSMSSACAPLQAGEILANPHYEIEDVREQMGMQLKTTEDGTIETLRVVDAKDVPAPVQDEQGNQVLPDGYQALTADSLADLKNVTQKYDDQIEALENERNALYNT